jgi:hypothetical protein
LRRHYAKLHSELKYFGRTLPKMLNKLFVLATVVALPSAALLSSVALGYCYS